MGNTNPTLGVKSSFDFGNVNMKGRPILYHRVHSENVQISVDGRKAKRVESFCKGICFSDRPIAVNERVHLKFAEVSTSWSGVVRLGLTSHDPNTINAAELPRYACPDLTYKPGYWAKALPEKYAEQGTTLFYYLTRSGDVMFGINGEEKGLFFSGVATNTSLWALVDIYGNTTCMEFIDGWQLNNLEPNAALTSGGTMTQDVDQSFQQLSLNTAQSSSQGQLGSSATPTMAASTTGTPTNQTVAGLGLSSLPPVKYHFDAVFTPLQFHHTMGRNVCLSSDRSLAVRLVEEYCNGYVFTQRPIQCGEALIIQILSMEPEYTGGLAFGMTSCDPITLSPDDLPDDSDLLLDRPEYWVVNKDVCTTPEVGDELSFFLTQEGEVRYGKNGHHIATLMYIDKTLAMWAFLDVYGNTQKIKCLGVIHPDAHGNLLPGTSGLTVVLPPPRNQFFPKMAVSSSSCSSSTTTTTQSSVTPPPRPPPPRALSSATTVPTPKSQAEITSNDGVLTPPVLPPKHGRSGSQASPLHPAILMQSPRSAGSPLPPPLLPTPLRGPPPSVPERHGVRTHVSPTHGSNHNTQSTNQNNIRPAKPLPQVPFTPKGMQRPLAPMMEAPDHYDEALDNETNECKVCMNNAVDCVLYTCGHMCLCYECAQDIKHKHNLCPICRQDIKDIIRIYRS